MSIFAPYRKAKGKKALTLTLSRILWHRKMNNYNSDAPVFLFFQ